MSDTDNTGEFIGAEDGERYQVLGITAIIKLTSQETGNAFSLQEDHVAPGFRAPLHLHRSHTETFRILQGKAEIQVGTEKQIASPGMTIHIPQGVQHAVQVLDQELRMMTTVTPGGFEGFFREIGALPTPDSKQLISIAKRYDTEFLEPLA